MNSDQYPVLEILAELREKLSKNPVVILQAPPGAGKSTVLPLKLMDEVWLNHKKIIMLEPRRLAAKSVAERMASLRNEPVGSSVGYRVRFDTKVSAVTRIEVVTEGILTRMLQTDNSLDEAGLLIFDEFHERSIHADLALTLALQVQQVLRPELRILIMSATLDVMNLSGILGNAPVISSQGKQFPVAIRYATQESDQHITIRTVSIIRKALQEEEGDILVFLPGAGEIKRTEDLLSAEPINAIVYPLYGDLTFKKQQEAILPDPRGHRKVVLATSIAETSLTIEGIKVVIDSGLSRVPRFDPRSGLTRLDTLKVTKDAADQRAGRAGRLAPGICYRLWTQGNHLSLAEQRKPEILEADLATLLLELLQWGIRDVKELTWITTPPSGAINQARELLQQLEAVAENQITARGKEMLALPTHPRLAHLILLAKHKNEKGLLALATDVAALLEERDPLDKETGADIALRIEALRKWRGGERVFADRFVLEKIEKVAANWRRLVQVSVDNSIPQEGVIGKLVWGAYPDRIAQQQGKHNARYKLANGRMVKLQQHDPLIRESLLAVAHLDSGNGEGRIFTAASVTLSDLLDYATSQVAVRWDEERSVIIAVKEKRLGPLLLESRHYGEITDEQRLRIFGKQVRETGLRIFGQDETRFDFQSRVLSLHNWRKEEPWPEVTDEYLLENLEEWLGPFLSGLNKQSELEKLNLHDILMSILPYQLQQKLQTLAPTRLQVPSGSMIAVQYSMTGSPPVMEVRLQEMFGLTETPTVNEGRTKVLLHLLSPGYKPVQVTQDLKSFWHSTYHDVRKELRMRYPKHHWPEDPWTAEAVRGAKRRRPG